MAELTRRYIVMAMATEAPFDPRDPEGVFVLKPWKDPAALRALETYRDNCYPELSEDLTLWIRAVESGTPIRGGVGKRNEPHVKAAVTAAARPKAAASRRAKPAGPRRAARATRKPAGKKRK
jgi:hypothetical protein